jgi:hypothetical protein
LIQGREGTRHGSRESQEFRPGQARFAILFRATIGYLFTRHTHIKDKAIEL